MPQHSSHSLSLFMHTYKHTASLTLYMKTHKYIASLSFTLSLSHAQTLVLFLLISLTLSLSSIRLCKEGCWCYEWNLIV